MASRLVAEAQAFVSGALTPGALAVDATVGRGGDALFLAERVGESGAVVGLDLQRRALAEAARRLAAAGLAERVQLRRTGHAHLGRALPASWRGRVAVVMFNLGYLPGGEKTRVTRPATTWAALDAAQAVLAPGGRLSVLAYRGHPGGVEEARTVVEWAHRQAPDRFTWEVHRPPEDGAGRPPWWLVGRRPPGGEEAG